MKKWTDVLRQEVTTKEVVVNQHIKHIKVINNYYTRESEMIDPNNALDVAKAIVRDLQVGSDGLPDDIVIRSRKASDDLMNKSYDDLFRNNFKLIPRIKYIGIQPLSGDELDEAILSDKRPSEKIDYYVYSKIVLSLDGTIHNILIKLPYATPSGEIVLNGRHKRIINIIEDVIITSSPYKCMFKLSRSKITIDRDTITVLINGKKKTTTLLTSFSIFNRVSKGEPYKGKHPLALTVLITRGLYNILSLKPTGKYINGYYLNENTQKVDDHTFLYEHKGSISTDIKFVLKNNMEMEVDDNGMKVPKREFVINHGTESYTVSYDLYTTRGDDFKYMIYVPKGIVPEELDVIKAILYCANLYPAEMEEYLDKETKYKDGRMHITNVVHQMTLTKDKGIISKIVNELVGALYNNFDARTQQEFMSVGMNIKTFDDFYVEVCNNYLKWLGQSRLVGSRISPMYSLTFPYASIVNNVFRNMSVGLNQKDTYAKYVNIINRLQRDIGYGKPLTPLKNKPLLCLTEKQETSDFDLRGMWGFASQESGNGVYEQTTNGGVNTRGMPLILQRKTPECLAYIDHSMLKKTSHIPLTLTPFIKVKNNIIQPWVLPDDFVKDATFLRGLIVPKNNKKD